MAKQKLGRGLEVYVPGIGVLDTCGVTVPTAGLEGYSAGCTFKKTNGSADASFYINQGSLTSCDFQAVQLSVATVAEGVGPSPLIWSDAPVQDVILDPTKGFYTFEDFTDIGGLSLAATGSENGYTLTERTAGTLANAPTVPGGVIVLDSTATTADQGGTMQMAGFECAPLDGTTIRMEWRCKVSEDGGQCFMGLCDDSMTAPVSASDAIVANNLAGFYRDTGTGDADWTAGCADGASNDELDDAATSVKTTYHKYGIVISGIGAVAGSTVEYYFDGVLVHTTTDISDIPLLLMAPCFQMDGDGTDRVTMSMDWLRILVSHATGLCRVV